MDTLPDPIHFAAPLLRLDTGMRMHYIPIPQEIAEALRAQNVRRLVGTFNGISVSRGVLGRKDGEQYLVIGQSLMREMRIHLGETVFAELSIDPAPDQVALAEEFEVVLEDDTEAAERFYGMTPGKQRSLSHYITSAKRSETRIKRSLEIAHKLRTYTLYGDKKKD